jgi:predicted RNase H-like HicB family nuclease
MHEINPIIYKTSDGYAGFAAELPGATGQGSTIDETIEEILDAIEDLVSEYTSRNVPVPWQVLAPTKTLKVAV